MSIKAQLYPTNQSLGVYLALHVIGHNNREVENIPRFDRHYGLGLGIAFQKLNLEVDIINFYHNFKENGLTFSGGIRWNIMDIFTKRFPELMNK